MDFNYRRLLHGLLFAAMLLPGLAFACSAADDGCLGCSDADLPACLNAFAEEICNAMGNPDNCDRQRVYDDAERLSLIHI